MLIASNIGVKHPKDWSKVTIRQIEEGGGVSLLKLYDNSIIKMLQSIFPGSF